jgi:hypothetical protein
MSRRQLGWIAAIGLSLLFLLATGKYAYDTNAVGAATSGFVSAGIWALTVLAALGNLLGLLGAIKDSSTSFALHVVNSVIGRLAIMALSVGLGAVFLVAALRVEEPRVWSCSVQRRIVAAPDRSRCAEGAFAQMRSFQLRLLRASELNEQPTLRAWVNDRLLSSVAVDSDRGGLCVATGPDQPTRGESRLVLSTDCGADRLYDVNLHLCDAKVTEGAARGAAELRAAVRLEMREGNNASLVECE